MDWVDEKRAVYERPQRPDENPFLDPPLFDMRGSEMPAWFVGFYNSYVAQMNALQTKLARGMPPPSQGYSRIDSDHKSKSHTEVGVREVDAESILEAQVDPAVLKKMNMDITLLEGGILFHSIFVGITISVTNDGL